MTAHRPAWTRPVSRAGNGHFQAGWRAAMASLPVSLQTFPCRKAVTVPSPGGLEDGGDGCGPQGEVRVWLGRDEGAKRGSCLRKAQRACVHVFPDVMPPASDSAGMETTCRLSMKGSQSRLWKGSRMDERADPQGEERVCLDGDAGAMGELSGQAPSGWLIPPVIPPDSQG